MKSLQVVSLLYFVVSIHAWGRGDLEKYGPFQWILNSKYIKCNHDRTMNLDVSGIDVYFYDFPNNIEKVFRIDEAVDSIISIPELIKVKKFFIYVGGFKSHINRNTAQLVRETFKHVPNSYLIVIDHSAYTHDGDGNRKSYERSVQYVYYIGRKIAQMLAQLTSHQISPKNMHCIGHSLGSQILGHTGHIFTEMTGQSIARITALDPAGPCFSKNFIEEQIRSGTADYVEVYHCNAGGLGSSSVLGDADFFLNQGGSQPDCGTPLIPGIFDSPKAAKCSHKRCVTAWMKSVIYPDLFLAYRCDKYKDFKNGKCFMNHRTVAGFWNPGNATGVYYLSTQSNTDVLGRESMDY